MTDGLDVSLDELQLAVTLNSLNGVVIAPRFVLSLIKTDFFPRETKEKNTFPIPHLNSTKAHKWSSTLAKNGATSSRILHDL